MIFFGEITTLVRYNYNAKNPLIGVDSSKLTMLAALPQLQKNPGNLTNFSFFFGFLKTFLM